MKAIFLADAHLRSSTESNAISLISFLEKVDADTIFILGDFFDIWWEYDQNIPPSLSAVCSSLEALKNREISLVFLPGNRDFKAVHFFERIGAHIQNSDVFEMDGLSLCLAHGDEADNRRPYRLMSKFLRSGVFSGFMHMLGPERGFRLLKSMAKESRGHQKPQTELLYLQKEWAQKKISSGAEFVIMGHSHHQEKVSLPGGVLFHIGDWASKNSFLSYESGSFRLESFKDLL